MPAARSLSLACAPFALLLTVASAQAQPCDCDDGNPCTTDVCESDGQCTHTRVPGCCTQDPECDDGNPCNGIDFCLIGALDERGFCVVDDPAECNDGDPCTVDTCDETRGRCTNVEHPALCIADEDDDGDGMWDRHDRCRRTPPGTRAVFAGCSGIDLVENPDALTGPPRARIAALVPRFGDHARPVVRLLGRANVMLETATHRLGRGRICSSAAQQRRAVRTLVKADKRLTRSLPRLSRTIVRTAAVSTATTAQASVASPADVRPGDAATGYLEALGSMLRDVMTEAEASADVASDLCDETERVRLSGDIATYDGASGLATTADGTLLYLDAARSRLAIAAGLHASRIVGTTLADDSVLVAKIKGDDRPLPLSDPLSLCLDLRLAPYQPAAQLSSSPLLLPFDGYYALGRATRRLYLEGGMGIAIESRGCPAETPDAFGHFARFSVQLQLVLRSGKKEVLNRTRTDLRPGDVFRIPAWAGGTQGTLTLTGRRQECTPACSGPYAVTDPVEYPVNVGIPGAYCTADYETDTFALEDVPPYSSVASRFAVGHVVNVRGAFLTQGIDPGTTAVFGADGWAVAAGQSSYPTVELISADEGFAVYPARDFYWNDPLDSGVSHAAGLAWPTVSGLRNGQFFRYACELPEIVRDLVSACPEFPDSFYRLPYPFGLAWRVGQGNDGTFTHNGTQRYAFDFTGPAGAFIMAGRGGTVVNVVESSDQNCYDASREPACQGPCPANIVSVLHQDGTLGQYFHMPTNGVQVQTGDVVYRGDVLGVVGNTGCSSGPHLHFHAWSPLAGQSTPSRFQTAVASCVIPKTGESHVSANRVWYLLQ